MHTHVMTDTDQEQAHALKNEILDLCLHRKVNTLVALAAARCAAECFESIINEQHGEVFEVNDATLPETPSDAAMRAARDVAESIYQEMFKLGGLDRESVIDGIAAIITRYLAGTPSPVAETGGFTCACCQRNMELRVNDRYCNECATFHAAAPVVPAGDDEGKIETRAGLLPLSLLDEIQERRETTYKGFGYEHYAPQMKTDLDHALAIAAALRTPVEGEEK